ncbi:MAG: hypothetical protein WD673_15565, partial [Alphaproteobacteria bacterium]
MVSRLCGLIVRACAARAALTLGMALVVTVALGALVVPRLAVDTSTESMIDADVPFRRDEIAYRKAFPRLDDLLVVVVEAADGAAADRAAAALASRMAARADVLRAVRRPDSAPLEARAGILYLPTDRVAALAERLVGAQPMLGVLAADPSPRGLLAAVDLIVEGIARGEVTPGQLDPSLDRIATAIESVLAGRPEPLDWGALLVGDLVPEDPRGNRRIIVAQPILAADSLAPAA